MFDNLSGVAYSIVIFAVVIGVGLVVLDKFGDANAQCATDYTYNGSTGYCTNATGGDATAPTNPVWTNNNYLVGQLGTSGLASWTPAIIAAIVGFLLLGLFYKRGRNY